LKPIKILSVFLMTITVLVSGEKSTLAVCPFNFLNPVTDIAWHGMFPIKIGGVPIGTSNLPERPDAADAPVCVCPVPPPIFMRPGIPISYYEPSRYIETVKDPWCFPSIGVTVAPSGGMLAGTHSGVGDQEDTSSFAQAHFFIFAPLALLSVLVDFVCVESFDFDVGYITEVDPLWNDDMLAMMINPEALVFANPVSQLSCIPDSVSANAGLPIDPLYWCMGSWGSSYPMTGHVNDEAYTQANAATAARLIYKLSRQGLTWDAATYLCSKIPMPIWIKSYFRFQVAKPIRGLQVIPIGRSVNIWGAAKNPTTGIGDNFIFVVFKKRACCAF
jgi:conjugal transfer pilus assembly protein TraU